MCVYMCVRLHVRVYICVRVYVYVCACVWLAAGRVLGELTRERLALLREADDIMIQEIRAAGI